MLYVGLDVHAETITVAVAEAGSLGTIANRLEAIRKLVRRLQQQSDLRACYEAGPTGYCLYWQLTQQEVPCEVIAPSSIPKKASERIKTDRRGRAEPRAGSAAGSGAGARSRQEGSVQSTTPAG